MIEVEEDINTKAERRIVNIYEAADEAVNEIKKIIKKGVDNPKTAATLVSALDKAASVMDKLQPLLRESKGLEVRDEGKKIGSIVAAALVAAERMRDDRKMRVIENEPR